jgi:hypothetical protein
MKKLAVILLMLVASGVQSQPKASKSIDTTGQKTDTLTVKPGGFIRLNDGSIVNTDALQAALKSGIVVASDKYWYELLVFMKTSKNGDFTAAQQEQMQALFIEYAKRYEAEQAKNRPK